MQQRVAVIILVVIIFACCTRPGEKASVKPNIPNNAGPLMVNKPLLVDYKSEAYHISVGQNYKVSEKIIDWRWAYLNDDDNKIDSTGKDAFLNLDEPLIRYNNGDWLPSLHIETDRNIITSFTCSILFDLADDSSAVDRFLGLVSKDIKQLKNSKIIASLKRTGYYEEKTGDYIEVFKLTKAEEYENDRFSYSVSVQSKAAAIGNDERKALPNHIYRQ